MALVKPTLESAISGMRKSIGKLQQVAETKKQSAIDDADLSDQYAGRSKVAADEAARASRIAGKLEEILA